MITTTKFRTRTLFASVVLLLAVTLSANAQTIRTVGTGGNYTTLKAAFDAINAGTITGEIELQIVSSITESATATLYQSGYTGRGGTSDYSSVKVYPTVSGLSITGNLAAPLINLNGADNVTIDGRVYASGTEKNMTIVNLSTSEIIGTSTLNFENDACFNNIKYCIIKGSTTTYYDSMYISGGGVINIGTSNGETGNDNITIDNCDITSSNDANRPRTLVFCNGSSTELSNDNFTISNCNLYNFFHRYTSSGGSLNSYGIFISSNASELSIINNSFFETTSFVSSGFEGSYYVISIDNYIGNFNISGNYIGGSAPLCQGTAWNKTGDNTIFVGIWAFNNGNTNESIVQNNTIKNINWTNSGAAPWWGISAGASDDGLLTVKNNIIGSGTGTGSIVLNSSEGNSDFYGIYTIGSVVLESNAIGSITTNNQDAYASNIYGIFKETGNCKYINNLIGSLDTPNSIYAASKSTDHPQNVIGIYIFNSGNELEISNNTIANLTNNTSSSSAIIEGKINGIAMHANPFTTITGNTIFNLKIANANTSTNQNASVGGIIIDSDADIHNVTDNKIFNLTNTNIDFQGSIYGIYFTSVNYTPSTVAQNFIHDLYATGASSTNANIIGIAAIKGNAIYLNNVISLGGNSKSNFYGIYDNSNLYDVSKIYYNTIYISGSASGGANKSYALYSASMNGTRDYKNNMFINTRSTTGESNLHYAAFYNYTANTRLTNNYNNYYVSGEGTTLAYFNATNISNLTDLKSAIGQDANSINKNPVFVIDDGNDAVEYKPTAYNFRALTISDITTDYAGTTRDEYPTIGAFEGQYNIVEVYINEILQGSYFNLRRAFNKINDGTHTGTLDVRINDNTLEDASAVLYQSGFIGAGGTSNYNSVRIYPTARGLSISGTFSTPLIHFDGADNITIDGRVNATGNEKSLTILKNNDLYSTLHLNNDASNIIIKYCIIKGSNNNTNNGVITIDTGVTTGNKNITIDNCDLTSRSTNKRPRIMIYCVGTTTVPNDEITISNNNIYDFFSTYTNSSGGVNTWGLYFGGTSGGSSTTANINILNNCFYETTSLVNTGDNKGGHIVMSLVPSKSVKVQGNYIGGSAPFCKGNTFTKSGNNTRFIGILTSVETATGKIYIENNKINNINWTNTGDETFVTIGASSSQSSGNYIRMRISI